MTYHIIIYIELFHFDRVGNDGLETIGQKENIRERRHLKFGFWGGIGSGRTAGSYNGYYPRYNRYYPRYNRYYSRYYPRYLGKRSVEDLGKVEKHPKVPTDDENEDDTLVEDNLTVSQNHAVSEEQKNLDLEPMEFVEGQQTPLTDQPSPRNGRTFWKKSYIKYRPTYNGHHYRYHDDYYPRHLWKRSAEQINGNDVHVDSSRKDLSEIQKVGTVLEHETYLVVEDSLDEHENELDNIGKKEVLPGHTGQYEKEIEAENAVQNSRTGKGFFWKSRSKYYPSYNRYYPRYQGSYHSHYLVKRRVGQKNENGEKSKGSILTE